MTMALRKLAAGTVLAAGLLAHTPATAQFAVFDVDAYRRQLEQVQNQLEQIEQLKEQIDQAKELYNSVNDFESIEEVATLLDSDQIRRYLPEDFDQYGDLLTGDLDSLGDLGDRIGEIRENNRRIDAPSGSDDFYAQALEQAGAQAARNMGVGEAIYDAASQRLEGLEELRASIDQSDSAAELMAISARLQAEQAMLQNDLMRMEGLTMVQRAEERMDHQRRAEEEARKSRERQALYESWGRQ